jgi:hypothetical protein
MFASKCGVSSHILEKTYISWIIMFLISWPCHKYQTRLEKAGIVTRRYDTQHNDMQLNDTQHNSKRYTENGGEHLCKLLHFFQIVMINVVVLSAVVSAALPNQDKSAARFCCQVAASSRICFTTFILWKVIKLLITRQRMRLEKKSAHIWNP